MVDFKNDQYQELIIDLDLVIFHLEKYKESFWALFFKKIKNQIINNDSGFFISLKGLRRGGMGSFNDFILCEMNGHNIKKEEEGVANFELRRLVNLIIEKSERIIK